jgi:hypothetical protein
MSQPEHEAIVNEIRASQIPASTELRERVSGMAASVPPAAPPREWPWLRWSLVLPAAAAVAGSAALAIGLVTSGGGKPQHSAAGRAKEAPAPLAFTGPPVEDSATTLRAQAQKSVGGAGAAGSVPATPGRAQLYESELTLKVQSLSSATKSALRLTRDYHGYVRSVEYGSGTERGSAYLVVRVPVGSVQAAIVKFSALGDILDQHVSIQDVQPTVDRRFRQMQAIRDQVAKIQAKLANPGLSTDERTTLENELVAQRRELVVLQKQATALARQTSFATVELSLRTADNAVAVPHDPNRIERALDRSGSILLDEVKVVLYVLIVGAPLLALAFLAFGGAKLRRRRTEERLLATS